ncbi:MAG: SDR family NAD(P)-dependent oxidoreductase [Spirochaetales bacterium]
MAESPPNAGRSVLITGASSGIGRALAIEMARAGYRVALTARRYNLLEEVRDEIEREDYERERNTQDAWASRRPGLVTLRSLDVRDHEQVFRVVEELAEELGGLDIVIANAGIGRPGQVGTGEFENAREIIEINLLGAMATVDAATAVFRRQGFGHIVGVSSVAGFRGLPGSAAYSASKAGLSTYLEGARAELYRHNVDVTVLHPGFIATPINEALPRRPFVISTEKAATKIRALIERRVKSSTIPRIPWSFLGLLFKVLPRGVIARIR